MSAALRLSRPLVLLSIFALFFVAIVPPVHAQLSGDGKDAVNDQLRAGASDPNPDGTPLKDPRKFAAELIMVFLSFLGTIMLVMMMLSGYWYFTARGMEDRITKAQDTARRAFIGLIITLMAYGVTRFVFFNIEGAVEQGSSFYEDRRPLNSE